MEAYGGGQCICLHLFIQISIYIFFLQEAAAIKKHQGVAEKHRGTVITQTYVQQDQSVPQTLRASLGGNNEGSAGGAAAVQHLRPGSPPIKPPWKSVRSIDVDVTPYADPLQMQKSPRKSPRGNYYCDQINDQAAIDEHGSSPNKDGYSSSSTGPRRVTASEQRGKLHPVDVEWEANLPRGLTAEKCVGLPPSSSVGKLVQVGRFCSKDRLCGQLHIQCSL